MVRIIAPAATTYRGRLTQPERWATWEPRDGDVLVCTPPKCGTTWTQTMIAMLLYGGPDLPDTLGAISPWVDADLGIESDEVARTIAALPGRRVVKTHTPGDGFPVWDGVHVIAVYRHPLDLFISLRKHIANRHFVDEHPMKGTISQALRSMLNTPFDQNDLDSDSLQNLTHHYLVTAKSGRIPNLLLLHYADMIREPRAALRMLAQELQIDADDSLIEAIAQATDINAMRANAQQYVPVGGTGFWKKDANFFAKGGIGNWRDELSPDDISAYETRIAELIPDTEARDWLENGSNV